MKQKLIKSVVVALVAGLVVAVFVGRAGANSETFAFTMDRILVDGNANKRQHVLAAGELTLRGEIWVHLKQAPVSSRSAPVRISVQRPGDWYGSVEICDATATPHTAVDSKQAFTTSCGRVAGGTYWIRAEKKLPLHEYGDGWFVKGAGTLTTK
jgi:hypothetical protein